MVPLTVLWVSGPVVSMDSVHTVACSDQHGPCWDKNGSGEVCDEEGDRILCELTDRGSYSCPFPRTGPKNISYSVNNTSNTADNTESDKCARCHLSIGAKQGPCVRLHADALTDIHTRGAEAVVVKGCSM